ncbi:MAG: hypothetical protein AB7T49_08045 [Oligoflexales bacterium]
MNFRRLRDGSIMICGLALAGCRSLEIAESRPLGAETTPTLFNVHYPLALKLSGPFDEAFKKARAGEEIQPGDARDEGPFSATLSFNMPSGESVSVAAQAKVRGQSSLKECSFSKMRFTIAEDAAPQFFYLPQFKLGTHCVTNPIVTYTPIGRLLQDIAAHREAFVYALLERLGFAVPKSRSLEVAYEDTSESSRWSDRVIKRKAFLFELIKPVVARYGFADSRDDDVPWTTEDPSKVAKLETSKMMFAQALTGNWDWRLTLDKAEIATRNAEAAAQGKTFLHQRNVVVFVNADGTLVPVPSDFDLAVMVTGKVRDSVLGDSVFPTEKKEVRLAAQNILKAKESFDSSVFEETKAFFVSKKSLIDSLVASYPLDPASRQMIRSQVQAFYKAMDKVLASGTP